MEGTIFNAARQIQEQRDYFKSIYKSETLVRSAMDKLDLSEYINEDMLNEAWNSLQKLKNFTNIPQLADKV